MTGYEFCKIMVISYLSIQLWMITALITEKLSESYHLNFSEKESFIFGPTGLIICFILLIKNNYRNWKIEQSKKWDR